MAGLLDIAAVTEIVTVGGVEVEVCGVSASGLAKLLSRFPEIRMLIAQKAVSVDRILEMGGEAVAAIIAAGTGNAGSKPHEAAADRLPIEAQGDLIEAIIRQTFPNGLAPFMAKMTGLLGVAASAEAPATRSPKPSPN